MSLINLFWHLNVTEQTKYLILFGVVVMIFLLCLIGGKKKKYKNKKKYYAKINNIDEQSGCA
jgi:hypothetical protein